LRVAVTLDLVRRRGAFNDVAFLDYGPRRARGVTIVAAHGYSSSKQNLDMLCAFLASHGFRVLSLDLPGHKLGASGGTLRGPDDLVDAMATVVAYARERYAGPVITLGHSLGAVTALLTAAADDSISGVVSIATGHGRSEALEALRAKGAVDLRSAYVDGPALPELMAGVGTRMISALDAIAGRPVLFVAAERDLLVSRASVEALFERAREPKEFAVVSSDHTWAGENARATVLAWLKKLP
jgi:alpha-beta hydrolase superfamily lysophospholipase